MGTVFPKVVFTGFGIPVRDTVVSTWLMMAIVVASVLAMRRFVPTALEMLIDFLVDLVSGVMERRAEPYLPFLGSLAIFIAVGNILSVVPAIPLPNGSMLSIVSPTADINTPLALALMVFFAVHYFGVLSHGLLGYLKSLATPVFVLPLEIISQLSRTISLTVRLFGNILSAEMIIAVVFALIPLFVPIPLIGFSIFTGMLQAYIFTALAAVYIASAVREDGNASS
jgi:F-type H+-transporting ATPase subunit a